MEVAFWVLLGVVGWSYVGYPLLLVVVARVRRRTLRTAPIEPSVTVIIAVHNEERTIDQKLATTCALQYPPDKLEIVVAADGCTDDTCAVVARYRDRGVRLIELPERGGKTAAQNRAAREARGEILVFTDATTFLGPDAIRGLVAHFADPRVGCVSAELEYESKDGTPVGRGGTAYWRYERMVKRLEAEACSLIGASGCLYAVRAAIYTPIEPELISDFVIASRVFERGCVTIAARNVVARELTNEHPRREFTMRVRIIVRSIHALVRSWRMLNPFLHGLFAVELLSHKVMRYLVPECLFAALLLNLGLVLRASPGAAMYRLLLAAQLAVYGAAALQWMLLRLRRGRGPLYLPFYFVHANLAAVWALVAYLRGERMVTWRPLR